jgi:hypothetical protein
LISRKPEAAGRVFIRKKLSGITPEVFSFTQKQVACNLNYKKQTKNHVKASSRQNSGAFVDAIGRGQ